MVFYVITLFPEIIEAYIGESIIKRAIERKLIKVEVLNLRDFATDKHRKVDDRAYGGGPGMVLKIQPLLKAVKFLNSKFKIQNSRLTKIILTSARGKAFNHKMATSYSKKYKNIVVICGRYEGIDERVRKVLKDEGYSVDEVSIGDYVLTGGELPALVMIDAVSRKIPGVLGKHESLEEKRLGVGVPAYTRPEVLKLRSKLYKVPKILLSGHHKNVEEWRKSKKHR